LKKVEDELETQNQSRDKIESQISNIKDILSRINSKINNSNGRSTFSEIKEKITNVGEEVSSMKIIIDTLKNKISKSYRNFSDQVQMDLKVRKKSLKLA
jgi:hypothetical protein